MAGVPSNVGHIPVAGVPSNVGHILWQVFLVMLDTSLWLVFLVMFGGCTMRVPGYTSCQGYELGLP